MPRPLLPLVLALPALAAGAPQDPFAEGIRWTHSSTASAPALPASVGLAARGAVVWAGFQGPFGEVLALDGAAWGDAEQIAADSSWASGAFLVSTAAAQRTDALFAVEQQPNPTLLERSTLVHRYDAVAASSGAPFVPAWTFDVGYVTNGPARIATDAFGDRVVVAVWHDVTQTVRIDWLDGASGVPLGHLDVPALSFEALDVASYAPRTAIAAGGELHVFEGFGTPALHADLAFASPALSLSSDGRTVAFGASNRVAYWRDQGGWQREPDFVAPAPEICARIDLSASGRILAIGWWNSSNGTEARFEVWDALRRKQTNEIDFPAGPQGFQNLPEVVKVTDDGSRAVFGSWGAGGSSPEVVLVQTGTASPLLEVDLPGSVRALDLDESGRRLAIAYKGHPQQCVWRDRRCARVPERRSGAHHARRSSNGKELPGRESSRRGDDRFLARW